LGEAIGVAELAMTKHEFTCRRVRLSQRADPRLACKVSTAIKHLLPTPAGTVRCCAPGAFSSHRSRRVQRLSPASVLKLIPIRRWEIHFWRKAVLCLKWQACVLESSPCQCPTELRAFRFLSVTEGRCA